jgi:hypothetical protein
VRAIKYAVLSCVVLSVARNLVLFVVVRAIGYVCPCIHIKVPTCVSHMYAHAS